MVRRKRRDKASNKVQPFFTGQDSGMLNTYGLSVLFGVPEDQVLKTLERGKKDGQVGSYQSTLPDAWFRQGSIRVQKASRSLGSEHSLEDILRHLAAPTR